MLGFLKAQGDVFSSPYLANGPKSKDTQCSLLHRKFKSSHLRSWNKQIFDTLNEKMGVITQCDIIVFVPFGFGKLALRVEAV